MGKQKKKIFNYDNRIIIWDDLDWFQKLLLESKDNYFNIYFEFKFIQESLKKVKNIILENREDIHFNNLYFYNANDFVNIILDRAIYLPKNINLFISEACPIWCNYCENINDIHRYLPVGEIKNFLSKYNVWDNTNFNILGQWDPIYNPDLSEILEYIKSLWWHITFFSWGKSLLYAKNIDLLKEKVDEFKINLSASNYMVYNKTHKSLISENDYNNLLKIFESIAYKSTFITIILRENIMDLTQFCKLFIKMWAYSIEIKKNLQYNKNDILVNLKVVHHIRNIISIFSNTWKINIISNIWSGMNTVVEPSPFDNMSTSILDNIIETQIEKQPLSIKEINNLGVCFQFGNSMDIIETKKIALCCHYDVSMISDLNYEWKYYENTYFSDKKKSFALKTPESCKKCPMPIDRYKNYLKYNLITSL